MEPITPQEGCQGHVVRECGMGDIIVTIFGKHNQLQEAYPIKWQMPDHSFSQAAAAHRITAHVAGENQWRPDHTVMLTGLLERLGINEGE